MLELILAVLSLLVLLDRVVVVSVAGWSKAFDTTTFFVFMFAVTYLALFLTLNANKLFPA
jgi:hypothetical protein